MRSIGGVHSGFFISEKYVKANLCYRLHNYKIHLNSLLLQLLVKHVLNVPTTSNYCPNTQNSVFR